jgi:predicted GH43/DUF377 family glycosyl hydrolase
MTNKLPHSFGFLARQQIWVFVIIVGVFFLVSYLSTRQHSDVTISDPPGSQLAKQGIVLPVGSYGEWDSGMVESPVAWFDISRKLYGMVYTGYASTDSTRRGYKYVTLPQVGLAWSSDLLHWKKDLKNPIFTGSGVASAPDAQGATGPFIWFENGTYFLFYIGLTAQGYEKGMKSMNVATSADLYTWKRYRSNPIIAPAGNGWRRDAIWHPNIVKAKDRYFLFFNASGVVHELVEEFIGYAMSKDLYHWWVDDVNSPLVVGSAKPGTWDASGRAGDPSVYKEGNIWLMAWYSWDKKNSADGLAWTNEEQFPLGWRIYEHNPVLRIGEPGSFDALHAGKPFMFRANDTLYHFYTAVALDEKRQIAVAICPDLRK